MIGDFALLNSELKRLKLDALVTDVTENTFYITSYINEDCLIVVKRDRIYYLTDKRYTLEAKHFLNPHIQLVEISDDPSEALIKILSDCSQIGFEDKMQYATYYKLFVKNRIKAIPVSDFLKPCRMIKNVAEKALIAHAASINDRTYEIILNSIREGITEREVRDIAESSFRRFGADGIAFETIVAFGENAAEPHHHVSDRRLKHGDCILIDMGCKTKGYCSDVTRTFFFGAVDNNKKMLYNKVLDCNRLAVDMLSDGVDAFDIATEVRNSFRRDGLDTYFTHSLGHGVGIQIHEAPYLSLRSSDTLQSGNVVTVEPGLYFAGDFGVRIEDLLYVDNGGAECLSKFDRGFIQL